MRFVNKLTIITLGIVIGVTATTAFAVYLANLKVFKENIVKYHKAQSINTLNRIDRMIFERIGDLKILSSDSILTSPDSTPKQITHRLLEYRNVYKTYMSLSFFTINRKRIADTSGIDIDVKHPPTAYWKDVQRGKDLVMDIAQSKSLQKVVFYIAHTVKDGNGKRKGLLVTRIPTYKFYDIIAQEFFTGIFQKDIKIDLVDNKGCTIYSNYNRKGILINKPYDWDAIFKARCKEETGSIVSNYSGEKVITVFSREQGYLDFKGNNWTLIVRIPTRIAFKPAIDLRNRVLLIALPFLIVSIPLIVYFSATITRPIVKLRNATNEIRRGKLDTDIDINTTDEIGELAASFKQMSLSLQTTTVSRDYMNNIIKSMLDCLFVCTPDGKIHTVNQSALNLLGYAENEVAGQPMDTFFPDRQLPDMDFDLTNNTSGKTIGTVILAKDGRKVPVLFSKSVMYDNNDKVLGIVCAAQDITAIKEAEIALNTQIVLLQTLIDSIPTPIFYKDVNGLYLGCNTAFEKYLGLTKDNIIGKSVYDVSPKDLADVYYQKDKELFLMPGAQTYESSVTDADGTTHEVVFYKSAFMNPDGSIGGLIGTIFDITERKQMEGEKAILREQLYYMQKLHSIGTLAGGVAHEFNNILMVIVGYGSLLDTKIPQADPLHVYVQKILKSAERAAQLTQGLLAFSRQQPCLPKPLNLNEIVEHIGGLLKKLFGESIILKIHITNGCTVFIDRGQMEQVLTSLAVNARDAMPNGGTLTISADVVQIDQEFIKTHGYGETGTYALLSVSDTGVGMDSYTLERIFDPFFTTKAVGKGTGLGLAVVYGIICQNNGYIDVESNLGKGTTFSIYLPIVVSGEERKKTEKMPVLLTGTETVVLAEDDEEVRRLNHAILTGHGYKVLDAVDGDDAIAKFIANRDKVQLLILDVTMPKKGGLAAYDEIKKTKPDAKVLFMTGYSKDVVHTKAIIKQGLDVISKPVSPNAFLRKVRETLDK